LRNSAPVQGPDDEAFNQFITVDFLDRVSDGNQRPGTVGLVVGLSEYLANLHVADFQMV
jgi:hypothetical protein